MFTGGELLDRTIAINNRIGDQRTFQLLDDDMLNSLANIHLRTEKKRKELLSLREKRQREYDQNYTCKLTNDVNSNSTSSLSLGLNLGLSLNQKSKSNSSSNSSSNSNLKENSDWKVAEIPDNLKIRSREIFVGANDTIQLIKLVNRQNTNSNNTNQIQPSNHSNKNNRYKLQHQIATKQFLNNNLKNPFIIKTTVKNNQNTSTQDSSSLTSSSTQDFNTNLILDFEDLISSNWSNVVDGIFTIKGALLGDLLHKDDQDQDKKIYQLKNKLPSTSQFIIRIRNIEKTENTITINNQKISAGLFDIVANCYYLLNILKDQNRVLHFYIPKCDHYLEARYYQQILSMIEETFSLPTGTLKVTIQIDTLNAFHQAEEILYELRDYCIGIYVYPLSMLHSYHKMYRNFNEMLLPNLSGIVQQNDWLNSLYRKLSAICKKRSVPFLVGYNNFLIHDGLSKIEKSIVKNNLQDELKRLENFQIDGIVFYHISLLSLLEEISSSKNNYNNNSFDLSSPSLRPIPTPTLSQSNLHLTTDNKKENDTTSTSTSNCNFESENIFSFLPKNIGPKTLNELRFYIRKGILFIESMLRNKIPLYGDYATFTPLSFDIIRWHTWHWIYHKANIDEWGPLNKNFVKKLFEDEYERLLFEQKEKGIKISHNLIEHWNEAKERAKVLFTSDLLVDFVL